MIFENELDLDSLTTQLKPSVTILLLELRQLPIPLWPPVLDSTIH